MISILCSNHPETLVERLAADLTAFTPPPPAGAFHVSTIVISNRVLQGFVTAEVARIGGIAANLRFCFLDEFAEELAKSALPGRILMRRYDLMVLLQGLFRDPMEQKTLPESVVSYLAVKGDDQDLGERKLFQLADQLSRIFEIYSVCRTDMVQAWMSGRSWFDESKATSTTPGGMDHPTLETESWQADLWRQLFRPGGRRDRVEAATKVRWITLNELVGELRQVDVSLPPHLHLFGFGNLSEAHRDLLEWLGGVTDVHVYTYAPFVDDAEPDGTSPGSILSGLWGRPGRENLRALRTLASAPVETVSIEPAASGLLGPLQREILAWTPLPPPQASLGPDTCLGILACPGIRRELEVVASEIRELVRTDSAGAGSPRLRFRDIAVVLANGQAREVYESHIQTVFADVHEIPFKIMNTPSLAARRVNEAVRMLLDLPLRTIERRSILPLLTHPLVRRRFPEADTDQWRRWCADMGVFFGADHSDHEGLHIEKDVYNFDQAIRRLVLGAFLTGQRSGDERTFDLGGMGYLPQELSQDDAGNGALFSTLVRSLVADARFAKREKRTLTDWTRLLTRQLAVYFEGESEDEKRALALCVKSLADLARHDVDGQPVSYHVLHGMVAEELESLASGRGSYLSEGVTVGSLASLCGLPFRVVFVCGLGEGLFPTPDSCDPLDLRMQEKSHREGDVFLRDQDRYRFLELFACTRQKLFLTYVARDSLTGNQLEPSSIVQELHYAVHRDHVFDAFDEKDRCPMVRLHPLRRFDAPYFGLLVNHDPAARLERNARLLGEALRASTGIRTELDSESLRTLEPAVIEWLGLVDPPKADPAQTREERTMAISLSAIRKFLECPLQGWARRIIGLEDDEEGDEPARWDEPFASDTMNATILLRNTFVTALAEWDPDLACPDFHATFRRLAEQAELRALAPTGRFLEWETRRCQRVLAVWLNNCELLGLLRDPTGNRRRLGALRFGRALEYERVEAPRDPILLEIAPPPGRSGGHPVIVELHGRTQILTEDQRESIVLVNRKEFTDSDHLRGFLDAVVLAVAEREEPVDHAVSVISTKPLGSGSKEASRVVIRGIERVRAKTYLEELLRDMVFEPHDYLFPQESVFDWIKGDKKTSLTSLIRKRKEEALASPERGAFSSTRGPLPNALDHEPPEDEAEAERLFERRFGLYFASKETVER